MDKYNKATRALLDAAILFNKSKDAYELLEAAEAYVRAWREKVGRKAAVKYLKELANSES